MISGTQSVDLYSSTGLSLDLVCFHLGWYQWAAGHLPKNLRLPIWNPTTTMKSWVWLVMPVSRRSRRRCRDAPISCYVQWQHGFTCVCSFVFSCIFTLKACRNSSCLKLLKLLKRHTTVQAYRKLAQKHHPDKNINRKRLKAVDLVLSLLLSPLPVTERSTSFEDDAILLWLISISKPPGSFTGVGFHVFWIIWVLSKEAAGGGRVQMYRGSVRSPDWPREEEELWPVR